MKPEINKNLSTIEISGIRKFFNLIEEYEDVVSLTIGQPDFPTPDHVKEAAVQAIKDDKTTYTHNAGIVELRKAITRYTKDRYQLDYDPMKEVIVTVGASQAIDITLRTIIEPGDEVILPGPIYPGYEPLVKLAGATVKYVDTKQSNFKLTAENLKEAITEKTKCVITPYPSNPTGVTLSEQELREISEVIQENKIFMISDEIYSELVYEQVHTSIASMPGMRDQVIVVNGVSKSFSMTGFRLGYLLAPDWLSKHILKVHQYNVSCASSVSQYAALEALENGTQDPAVMKKEYKNRREYVKGRLDKMGLEYAQPDGAFYMFVKFPESKNSTFDTAIELVEKAGVALVPGSAFSEYGEGYMRLSYAYSQQTLEKGMDRMERYLTVT
ncbi:aminotransferase A [Halobacillus sp. A1]|uniref:aminotransferase A n=1 Tax=Halobacillus sp. A1 TaxID=2880262 RepID=UPI0020A637CB|nr:aminotransferase A [Halobacillus sp. A1]MCP3030631.1 aminotransferase A [Halobacillus sp. A1]